MFFVSPIHFFLDQYYSRVLAHNSYFKERPKSRLWPDGDDASFLYGIDVDGIQHSSEDFPFLAHLNPVSQLGWVV